jgi:hypothetical protein
MDAPSTHDTAEIWQEHSSESQNQDAHLTSVQCQSRGYYWGGCGDLLYVHLFESQDMMLTATDFGRAIAFCNGILRLYYVGTGK